MTEEDAKSKDWVGVNAAGSVTAFIPRRPLAEMRKLSQAGLLQTKGEHLVGGINLGSIAASRSLLDELLDEFSSEIDDATAERNQRPDLDPQFFTVFMFALLDDPLERERCYREGVSEVPALARLSRTFPDLLARLRDVVERFAGKHGRKPKVVAMDFGDQYWGDIGQHQQIYSFYMALNQDSADGRVARALAGLHQARDANGNLMTAATKVSSGIEVRNSVLIDCELSGSGTVEDCVLVGSRVHDIVARQAFDILSCVRQLTLEARAGCYKVISREAVVARPGERVTSLFLPGGSQELLRVHEDMDLRDRAATYEARVLGNPLSFAEAHSAMSEMSAEQLAASREKQVEVVLAALRIRG
jgi:hypothetical protein